MTVAYMNLPLAIGALIVAAVIFGIAVWMEKKL